MRFLLHHGGPIEGGIDRWPREFLRAAGPLGLAEAETCIPRRPGQTGPVAVLPWPALFCIKPRTSRTERAYPVGFDPCRPRRGRTGAGPAPVAVRIADPARAGGRDAGPLRA